MDIGGALNARLEAIQAGQNILGANIVQLQDGQAQLQAGQAQCIGRNQKGYVLYIYIKLILLAPACTVVQQTDNGCNNSTINNTNTNDKVYKIDIAYKIYNMYRILNK